MMFLKIIRPKVLFCMVSLIVQSKFIYGISFDFSPEPRIIGGKKAKLGQFPSQVFLGLPADFQKSSDLTRQAREFTSCGGTIVHESWIITTASCITFVNEPYVKPKPYLQDIIIFAGAINVYSKDAQRRKIRSWKVCPRYMKLIEEQTTTEDVLFDDTGSDLVLIEVDSPFEINQLVKPIKLAREFTSWGSRCETYGWGGTSEKKTDTDAGNRALLFVEQPTLNSTKCDELYRSWSADFYFPKNAICAGFLEGKTGLCKNGERGAGLVCNETLVGVFTGEGPKCGYPLIYADILFNCDWLKEVVADIECGRNSLLSSAHRSSLNLFYTFFSICFVYKIRDNFYVW